MISDLFIKQLLEKAEFDTKDEEYEQVTEELREALIDRVMNHIADKLDEKWLEALNEFYDSGQDDDDIHMLLSAHIENYDWFMDDVYASFEKMYLETILDDNEQTPE